MLLRMVLLMPDVRAVEEVFATREVVCQDSQRCGQKQQKQGDPTVKARREAARAAAVRKDIIAVVFERKCVLFLKSAPSPLQAPGTREP